jgi:hypothetical protein
MDDEVNDDCLQMGWVTAHADLPYAHAKDQGPVSVRTCSSGLLANLVEGSISSTNRISHLTRSTDADGRADVPGPTHQQTRGSRGDGFL